MVLGIDFQVVRRSHEVWGDDEKLSNAKEHRQEKKELQKQRKFDKKIKGKIQYRYNINGSIQLNKIIIVFKKSSFLKKIKQLITK